MTQQAAPPGNLNLGAAQAGAAGGTTSPFQIGAQPTSAGWSQPSTPTAAGGPVGGFSDQSGQVNWELMSSVLGYDAYAAYQGYIQNHALAQSFAWQQQGRRGEVTPDVGDARGGTPSPTDWFNASLQAIDPANQVMSLIERSWVEQEGTPLPADLRQQITDQINQSPGTFRQLLFGMSQDVKLGSNPQTISNYLLNYTALGPLLQLYQQQHTSPSVALSQQTKLDQQFQQTLGRHLNAGEYDAVKNMSQAELQNYMNSQPYKMGHTLSQWQTALQAGKALYERAYGRTPDDNTVGHWAGMNQDQIQETINSGKSVLEGLNVGQYLGYHDALQSEWQKNYGTPTVPADIIQQFHQAQQAG